MWQKGEFEKGLLEARRFYDRMPYLCAFYLNYREKPNDIGYALLKIEKSFKRKLKQNAPHATPEQINTMFAVYFGVVYSPFVGEKEIYIYCTFIRDIFKKLG